MMSLPFLVPVHRLPIPSFEAEWLAGMLGLLCALALLFACRREPLAIPIIATAPLLLIAVVACQALLGLPAYSSNAWVFCAYLGFAALLAVCGHMLSQSLGLAVLYRLLAWAVLASGLANAGVGLLQASGLELSGLFYPASPTPGEGVYGNVAQQNHFATCIALALASLAYLRRSLVWRIGAGLVLVGALLLSGSRSSLLYLICIGAACWLCRARAAIHWSKLGLGLGALVLGLAALALGASAGWLGPRIGRLVNYSAALGPRWFLWDQAWQMFLAHPLLGVGIDRFAEAMTGQLRPGQRIFGIDQYAHNLLLQLLAVTGLMGLLAIAAPLAAWLRAALRRHTGPDAMWAWSVLAILGVHSMLEQPLYYSYFLGMGACVAGSLDTTWRRARLAMAGLPASAAALVALVALLIGAFDYQTLADDFYGPAAGDPYDPRHQALVLRLHRDPLFTPLSELISPQVFVAHDAPIADKLALNTRLHGYAPTADVAFRQAALLAEAQRTPAAKAQFDRAARAYPDQTEAYRERFIGLGAQQPEVFGELAAHVRAGTP